MQKTIESKKITTYQLAVTGLMTALTCILGPMSLALPFTPVPISLTNFVVFLSVWLLGWRLGTVSYLIYLLLGLAGLPVFSGFTGGAGKLLGPTGGYLIGFIFLAVLMGIVFEKSESRLVRLAGMILGMIVAYLFGTAWLAYQSKIGLFAALGSAVIPFIPGDLVKMAIVLLIGPAIEARLKRAGLLS